MWHDLALASPLLIVLGGALFTLLVDPFLGPGSRRFWGPFGALVSIAAIGACALLWKTGPHNFQSITFSSQLSVTNFSLFFMALTFVCGALGHLVAGRYLEEHGCDWGEYYILVGFATFGMATMVAAESLLTLFVALEIMSLSIYVLVSFKRQSAASVEGGLKYFILGSVASAFMLLGIAYVFGVAGGVGYSDLLRALATTRTGSDALFVNLAVLLLLGAFLFKVAAVPFHMWTPDAYEGAPTPVAALMASGVKVAAFGALLKIWFGAMQGPAILASGMPLHKVIIVFAVLTMTAGNLMALSQASVKRMLAYSAIAHAGYLLLGLLPVLKDPSLGPGYGLPSASIPFYLVGYVFASFAAFGALAVVGARGQELTTESQVAGLGFRYPFAGAVLTLAMLSLAGIPTTAGFLGKLVLFRDVLGIDDGKYLWLVVVAVLNSLVSVYYYLRVIVFCYMRREPREAIEIRERPLTWALALASIGILFVGILPARTLGLTERASADTITRGARDVLRATTATRSVNVPGPAPVPTGR